MRLGRCHRGAGEGQLWEGVGFREWVVDCGILEGEDLGFDRSSGAAERRMRFDWEEGLGYSFGRVGFRSGETVVAGCIGRTAENLLVRSHYSLDLVEEEDLPMAVFRSDRLGGAEQRPVAEEAGEVYCKRRRSRAGEGRGSSSEQPVRVRRVCDGKTWSARQ